ncbi:alkaline phosphatase family protein [Brevibacillus choshinensis]|uniref:alkaline phosphatase family protein n=1 Tax=Brevibacillus choshinensis TaxID=54911 RepID=UPI002E1CCACD|nr:alkaline phosphatase family protein [Brevibacillus choshinensis]MED4753655.1 alkaline phosphatase family protein [Brevibacillus choshinensis]
MNVLISLDGLSHQNFERSSQQFIRNGFSYCKKLITTFPSVTFHAHATAMTGSNHDKHLVFDNVVSRSGTMERIELYGDHEIICNEALHEQTLFYSLAANERKSCCIHWPMTSGNPYIHHLVTESSSKKKMQGTVSVDEIDTVALHETIQAIESATYDFIAARFIGYDALSHQYGKDSMEAAHCLEMLFEHIGQIDNALKKSHRPYNLIVFSDHGQSDVRTFFYPNEILAQSRWQQNLHNNQIRFVGDGSGSLLFYSSLEHQKNREIMDYFSALPQVNLFYALEGESSSEYRPVGILDLNHTVCGEDIVPPEQPKYKNMKSLHGYHPANVDEMNGFMVCKGDQIAINKIMDETNIENIAPTIAALFQISHPCDGRKIKDMIREYD